MTPPEPRRPMLGRTLVSYAMPAATASALAMIERAHGGTLPPHPLLEQLRADPTTPPLTRCLWEDLRLNDLMHSAVLGWLLAVHHWRPEGYELTNLPPDPPDAAHSVADLCAGLLSAAATLEAVQVLDAIDLLMLHDWDTVIAVAEALAAHAVTLQPAQPLLPGADGRYTLRAVMMVAGYCRRPDAAARLMPLARFLNSGIPQPSKPEPLLLGQMDHPAALNTVMLMGLVCGEFVDPDSPLPLVMLRQKDDTLAAIDPNRYPINRLPETYPVGERLAAAISRGMQFTAAMIDVRNEDQFRAAVSLIERLPTPDLAAILCGLGTHICEELKDLWHDQL